MEPTSPPCPHHSVFQRTLSVNWSKPISRLRFHVPHYLNAILLSAALAVSVGCTSSPPLLDRPTATAAGFGTQEAAYSTPAIAIPTSTSVPTPASTAISPAIPQATPTPASPVSLVKPEPRANTALLREQAVDIRLSELTGLIKEGNTIHLARQSDGAYVTNGVLVSEQHLTAFPFNTMVMSWNAETPAGTSLQLQLRIRVGDSVSPWFTMGAWSATGGASVGGQSNEWGKVDVDTLELRSYANSFQYRVAFATSNPAASPRLRSAAIVYSDLSTQLVGPRVDVSKGWIRDLDVPQYSQLEQSPDVARSICSPTSLAMVLNYWGKSKTVGDVYNGVRDARTGIFGNWPLNTAYAGSLGLDAYVNRLYSMEQVQNEIANGRPVIISIRFQPGQLDNSPIDSTTGHLIVVRGFTPQGDVIVNDPIAPNSTTVRRVYRRDQLTRIWQQSGGIAYMLRPR